MACVDIYQNEGLFGDNPDMRTKYQLFEDLIHQVLPFIILILLFKIFILFYFGFDKKVKEIDDDIVDIRNIGLMGAIEFSPKNPNKAFQIFKQLFKNGALGFLFFYGLAIMIEN